MATEALLSRLKLKQLRLAVAVDEHASILRAAQALGMSQPAATKILRDLEQDAGCALFLRTNRGVVPTEHGRALVRHGKLVLAQLTHAVQELEELTEGTGGRVAVGTLVAASATLLPLAIAQLRRDRPRVSVMVTEATNDRLVPTLRTGDLDFIVGRLPDFRYRDELVQEPLYTETIAAVVRAGHALARRRALDLAELAGHDWILPPPETTLRRQIEKAFHDAGLEPPRPAVQSISLVINRRLLRETDMIGALPRQVVREDARAGLLHILPVELPPAAGPVGISRRRNVLLSPAAQALVEALKVAARRLGDARD